MKTRLIRKSLLAVAVTFLLALSSCTPQIVETSIPRRVSISTEFELIIEGAQPFGLLIPCPGGYGIVFQIPNALQVLGFTLPINGGTIPHTVDDPAALAPFNAEPGHYLTSVSDLPGQGPTPGQGAISLRLRAPSFETTGTIKFSLLGSTGMPSQPAGLDFAAILGAPFAVPITFTDPDGPVPSRWEDKTHNLGQVNATWIHRAADADLDGRADLLTEFNLSSLLAADAIQSFDPSSDQWNTLNSNLRSRAGAMQPLDFDGDGIGDIVTSEGELFRGSASGYIAQPELASSGGNYLAIADINGDGLDDVVLEGPRCFLAQIGGAFVEFSQGLNTPGRVFVRDFDNDGHLDILAGDQLYHGDSTGAWVMATTPPGFSGIVLDVADFDFDGKFELVVDSTQFLGYQIYRTASGASSTWVLDHSVGSTSEGRGLFLNLDGGAQLELLLKFTAGWELCFFDPSSASFEPRDPEGPLNLMSRSQLTAGDFDGDGFDDIAGFYGSNLRVMFSKYSTDPLQTCGLGSLGTSQGTYIQSLLLNGSEGGANRVLSLAPGQALTIDVLQPPAMATPSRFIIWGITHIATPNEAWNSLWGDLCFIPETVSPRADRFTLVDTFASSGLAPGSLAPWQLTAQAGLPLGLSMSLQGMIENGSSAPLGLSVTNAVGLVIQ